MRRNFFSEDFVRIISGKVRGMKLVSPTGEDTRPTLDRVKEAIFSMLLPYIVDSKVLDLFAGSGALGIESISRGARRCFFIDNSKQSIKCITTNIKSAQFEELSEIINLDSLVFLKQCTDKFDIIFIDPPYSQNLYKPALELIAKNKLINDDGIIVLEYDYSENRPSIPDEFEVVKEKKYGRIGVIVLKRGLV